VREAGHLVVPVAAQKQKRRSVGGGTPADLCQKKPALERKVENERSQQKQQQKQQQWAYHLVKELERGLVSPMQVVQEHHQWLSRLDARKSERSWYQTL
jgi:hypothetical protein